MTLKTYLPFAAALLIFAGCSNCNKCDSGKDCTGKICKDAGREITYTGVLPAADAEGIEYTLLLDYDDDGKGGDYKLTERYIGVADGTFISEGDFTIHKDGTKNAGKRYLKLVPDHSGQTEVIYFLVNDDSSLTLTNASLQPPASTLNYTLTRK